MKASAVTPGRAQKSPSRGGAGGRMEIILCHLEEKLGLAWCQLLATQPKIQATVLSGDITCLSVDAVVSPANSFGFMDGGVDLGYSHTMGWQVQGRLQKRIKALPCQELLVGQALSVRTGYKKIPWLIAAPTMRVPCRLPDGLPVYLAARAATIEAVRIGAASVAFPGLGTGTGGVPYEIAARLMIQGIHEGLYGKNFPGSLRELFMLVV